MVTPESSLRPSSTNSKEFAESRRKKRHQEIAQRRTKIEQKVAELGINVIHEITMGFLVDDKGNYHILRETHGEIADHPFLTINEALNQVERVIEEKLGFQEKIGSRIVKIDGENKELVKIGTELLEAARCYPTIPLKKRRRFAEKMAKDLIPQLENARNLYKKQASQILKEIIVSESPDQAEKFEQAGRDVFEAAINGIRILSGETVRFIAGTHWQDIWEKRAIYVYKTLMMHYDNFLSLKGKKREACIRGIIGSLKGSWGMRDKLNSIKGNPYFKRIRSREIRRLEKIEKYLEKGDFKSIERTLVGAIKKLRAIPRDRKRRTKRQIRKPHRA